MATAGLGFSTAGAGGVGVLVSLTVGVATAGLGFSTAGAGGVGGVGVTLGGLIWCLPPN